MTFIFINKTDELSIRLLLIKSIIAADGVVSTVANGLVGGGRRTREGDPAAQSRPYTRCARRTRSEGESLTLLDPVIRESRPL